MTAEYATQDVADLLETCWPGVTLDNVSPGQYQAVERVHDQFLEKAYGSGVMSEYHSLKTTYTPEGQNRLTDFMYRTGLCNDAPLHEVFRGRETLRMLLEHIDKLPGSTLADLGSGHGRNAHGLAVSLERLERIYAVDRSPYAFSRARANGEHLNLEAQAKLESKILAFEGDYTERDVHAWLRDHEPDGVDTVLLAYQHIPWEIALDSAGRFTRDDGHIVAAIPVDLRGTIAIDNPEYTGDVLNSLLLQQNETNHLFHWHFEFLAYTAYIPGRVALLSIGRRILPDAF